MSSSANVIAFGSNRFFSDSQVSGEMETDLRSVYDAIGIIELENVLREKIKHFQSQRGKHGYGYRALASAIEAAMYKHLAKQGLPLKTIENTIDKRTPSHTYIRKFREGQNICINYMNTLAFFFDVKYLVNNFEFE